MATWVPAMFATRYCPECARPIPDDGRPRADAVCPACGAAMPNEPEDDWTNVARVTSLAEAGFLADELAGDDLEVRIYRADEFSALSDRWTASYFIQAISRDAHAAATRIRRHLTEMDAAPLATDERSWGDDRSPADLVFWRPVVMVVLAGVVSFIVGQKFAAQREAVQPPRSTLSGAVDAIGRPLTTEPVPGLPRHRLFYDGRRQAWYLDTDANGDGRYESRQRFHSTGAGW